MRKLSLLLMIGTFLTPWSVKAADCQTAPDCASLGFTTDVSKCKGSALKCPWDTSKAACEEKGQESPLPILYGDGTVTKEILSGKTPIGVVFDETNKLAVALTDVKEDGTPGSDLMNWTTYWSSNKGTDHVILRLETCGSISSKSDLGSITCGVDGRVNTDRILADDIDTPAAEACNKYEPAGCTKDFCKKTKWFLPSLRDLHNIYIAKDQLNAALTSLSGNGATTMASSLGNYWSSTIYNSTHAWFHSMGRSYWQYDTLGGATDSRSIEYVRPVIYYGEPKVITSLPILYGDGTVSKDIVSGKTPVGIVFDEANKLAVALTDVTEDGNLTLQWSNKSYNIPSLDNCDNPKIDSGGELKPITCSVDGRANTDKILACGSNCGGTPAAEACNKYEPTGCIKGFCKKNQWFLPSMRDLQNMYVAKDQLDITLISLSSSGATKLSNSYWSSTEKGDTGGNRVWKFLLSQGRKDYDSAVYNNFVRPVVSYGVSTDLVTPDDGFCLAGHKEHTCSGKTYCCPDTTLTDCSEIRMKCYTTDDDDQGALM